MGRGREAGTRGSGGGGRKRGSAGGRGARLSQGTGRTSDPILHAFGSHEFKGGDSSAAAGAADGPLSDAEPRPRPGPSRGALCAGGQTPRPPDPHVHCGQRPRSLAATPPPRGIGAEGRGGDWRPAPVRAPHFHLALGSRKSRNRPCLPGRAGEGPPAQETGAALSVTPWADSLRGRPSGRRLCTLGSLSNDDGILANLNSAQVSPGPGAECPTQFHKEGGGEPPA